ncbi:MAG: L-rhamnose isomerase [Deltaproteobacteria bacterium]|jgi:L-rhamnose isomerase|nr:L-rhamnose isomerase [Deltaproteobacteria bacterium]
MSQGYQRAKERYAKIGVDSDLALEKLKDLSISIHCWQGDDVTGFDQDGPLTGGIQVTGNYPGRARNPGELMADLDKALSLIPGKHRLNLHASYPIFEKGQLVDRDRLEPRHFKAWVDFAQERGLGLDFNPTFFSHPKAQPLTLSSPDPAIRKFWVDHLKASLRVAESFAERLGKPSLINIWIPDGLKDLPADRLGPRKRFRDSLDEALAIGYDKSQVFVSLESKVFGIGLEAYTVGSSEFCLLYAKEKGLIPLLDNGHYHPTEVISDKISSLLLFFEHLALHVTRAIRWDSDHVVLFDDETREIAKELVAHKATSRAFIGLDFFDGSINRIAAWVAGARSLQKAFLMAFLRPNNRLMALQDSGQNTELMVLQDELKTYPLGEVWAQFCELNGVPGYEEWLKEVRAYETEVLSKR